MNQPPITVTTRRIPGSTTITTPSTSTTTFPTVIPVQRPNSCPIELVLLATISSIALFSIFIAVCFVHKRRKGLAPITLNPALLDEPFPNKPGIPAGQKYKFKSLSELESEFGTEYSVFSSSVSTASYLSLKPSLGDSTGNKCSENESAREEDSVQVHSIQIESLGNIRHSRTSIPNEVESQILAHKYEPRIY